MKRAAVISLLALCAACKQQDPAVLIDMSGPFLVPANADKLHLEVVEWPGGNIIRGKDWCYNAVAGCDVLPAMPQGFSASVTGAVGLMSGKASAWALSATLVAGILPSTILQKMQSGIRTPFSNRAAK